MNLAAEQTCAFHHILSFDLSATRSRSLCILPLWLPLPAALLRPFSIHCFGRCRFAFDTVICLRSSAARRHRGRRRRCCRCLNSSETCCFCCCCCLNEIFIFFIISFWSCSIKFATFLCGTDQWAALLLPPRHIVFKRAPLLSALNLSGLSTELEDNAGRRRVWVLWAGAWIYVCYVRNSCGLPSSCLYIVCFIYFLLLHPVPIKVTDRGRIKTHQ